MAAPLTAVAATSASACEPHRAFIEAQLRLRRNAMAIYQDLVDCHGYAGAYNSVKRFANKLRHSEPEQFDRLAFLPGEEMQVDYGEGALTRVPGTERWRKPRLFVATLRYSRRSFRCVVWRSSQQTWARLHEQAWRHFGGSGRYVVLDNLKEGVLKPDLYEPELNPVYAAALKHYGVVADPARVRDPNRKGTVEHAIGHTQATALKGRRFETIEAQNTFLEHWEAQWAALRIHGSERRQVRAMFEEEGPHLQPLPLMGMQYFTEAQRTVCDDSCVRVDLSSYAARPAPIGSRVLVRVFEHRIEIRDLTTRALLRSHPRAERPGTVVLPADERVFNPAPETRHLLGQAKAIGVDAERLCELLFAIEGRVGQRKLWGIVSLAERYPRRLVNSACTRALADGIYSYWHVKAATEKWVVGLDNLFLTRRISETSAELLQTVVHQRCKQRRSLIVTSNRMVRSTSPLQSSRSRLKWRPPMAAANGAEAHCAASQQTQGVAAGGVHASAFAHGAKPILLRARHRLDGRVEPHHFRRDNDFGLVDARDAGQKVLPDQATAGGWMPELRAAHGALSEITGAFSADDLLGEIFGKFCIGK